MQYFRVVARAVPVLGLAAAFGASPALAGETKPTDGWGLHIDAKRHFPAKPDMIAHHYCKPVAGGLTECLLFESDDSNARLVGVEVVVPSAAWAKFGDAEKRLWHYHKTEIPKVSATLPDLSPEEAAKVGKSLEETYGKIYLLWDPGNKTMPTGRPGITIIK